LVFEARAVEGGFVATGGERVVCDVEGAEVGFGGELEVELGAEGVDYAGAR
jgi:hypothetical protein